MRKGRYYRFVCVYNGSAGQNRNRLVPIIIQYKGVQYKQGEKYFEIELLWYEGFRPREWTPPYTEREKDREYGTLITAREKIIRRIESIDQEPVKKEVMLLAL